jgi:hypothetical protein
MAVIFPEAIAAEADKRQARGDFGADRARGFEASLREIPNSTRADFSREPNPPGSQGHKVIPKKGETATFYLTG